ncbi:TipAS antibiotic-recognition domain-containing protein [Georgenia yuyongxinii]
MAREVRRPEGLLDRLGTAAYRGEDGGEWPEELRREESEMADRMVRLAELMASGTPPTDAVVLDEIDWYFRAATQYGGVDAVVFTALGEALAADEDRRALFDDVSRGLAGYQREAMAAYAQTRLVAGGA